MEVVGGVASIITLIEATGVLAEVSKNLVLRWRNAPHEIQALATRLSLLAAELQSIKNATSTSHPVLTDAIIRQSLSDLLTDVRKRLTKLQSLHFRIEQCGPIRQKFQWTVKDAGSAEKMLNKTQEVEQRLANLMTLISLRAQTPILDGLDRIEQMVSTLVIALPASIPAAPATLPTFATNTSGNTPTRTGSGLACKRTLVTSPWTTGKGWEKWGFRGALITTKQGYNTDYNINFSISFPLARILGSYAFTGCLSLQSTPLCRSSFTFRHPSYFAVARVVEHNHPFMVACRNGDSESVRFMLRTGEGRPTDVTADGLTPMFYASQKARIEVVAELLECGVEVDAIVDVESMSTMLEISSTEKQLDLVRFLLHHGASADRMSSWGCGPSALCWSISDLVTKHSSMDIYNVLSESAFIDLRYDEHERAAAVYFAAETGCGSQIDSLVRFGYECDKFGITPAIWFAADHGNYSSYSALVSHFGRDAFEGSTANLARLLLITILSKSLNFTQDLDRPLGYDEILRDLLQRCRDDQTLPLPSKWIPASIRSVAPNKGMTATELAAALGPDLEAWYLGVVRSCGFLSVYEKNEAMQRLRDLSLAGHVTTCVVYESEDEFNELGGYKGCEREDRDESSALSEKDDADINGSDESSTESKADEADQFWDASESVC